MDQQNNVGQNNRAQTQAHAGGLIWFLVSTFEDRVKDRRGFWLTLLTGIVLLLAAVYGFPHLVALEP